jgi:hypothetical protein
MEKARFSETLAKRCFRIYGLSKSGVPAGTELHEVFSGD